MTNGPPPSVETTQVVRGLCPEKINLLVHGPCDDRSGLIAPYHPGKGQVEAADAGKGLAAGI
jgi:hypothetical protein